MYVGRTNILSFTFYFIKVFYLSKYVCKKKKIVILSIFLKFYF